MDRMMSGKWAGLVVVLLVLAVAACAQGQNIPIIADPEVIESGGTTQLIAPATVDLGAGPLPLSDWLWSKSGNVYPEGPGVFSPSVEVQNPTWTAPGNPDLGPRWHTLALRCKAWYDASNYTYAYGSVKITELAFPDVVSVTPTAEPAIIAPGEGTQLRANAIDSYGHEMTYSWSDCMAGGKFSPSAEVADPMYTPLPYATAKPITLRVKATCAVRDRWGCRRTEVAVHVPWHEFNDLGTDYWAYEHLKACYEVGLFAGYPDNTIQPEGLVTRAQLAVILARMLWLVPPGH